MPASLEPLGKVKCTYDDCYESFDTVATMKRHKKYSDHDYCHKCDEDFPDFEAFAFHKILKPDVHNKACRVCGDEFKSVSGMRRHIELNHKVDQKLICVGCQQPFYRACLFIEHLEFGHCSVISPVQFQKHIVHKLLITQLLEDSNHYDRFLQKQAKFDAAVDHEEEGGVDLGSAMFDDHDIEDVNFKALEPDNPVDPVATWDAGPYPPLPTRTSSLASALGGLSLTGVDSGASTVVNSPTTSPVDSSFTAQSFRGHSARQVSSTQGSTDASISRQPKVWGSRDGKSTSSTLFPGAKPTPAPSEFSIAAYDDKMNQEGNLNIMKNRFWDPQSTDWNPERFYDAVLQKYYCPFVCEQNFLTRTDLNHHITNDHRIERMKCPTCLKYFKSATALMAHCESHGAKCEINKAEDFNIFLDRMSGGFLAVEEKVRPDHLNNPSVIKINEVTGRPEPYQPPVANYLQYAVTKPPDWKEPEQQTVIGGIPNMQQIRW